MNFRLPNNTTIVLREALVEDTRSVLDYMNVIMSETKNLSREPEEWNMTLEDEQAFIKRTYESKHGFMLIALDGDNVIAAANFAGSSLQRLGHRVSLGISVLREYRNMGIGSHMMDLLIQKAREYGKRTIDLEVRADNERAIHVYEKLGFVHEGRKREAFYVDDEYVDLVQMAKHL